jgi:hypothetical protein
MEKMVLWEAGAIVEKAYQDDKGRMHVVAVASDDATDLQSDQMSKSALEKMADQANGGVPLLDNHKSTFEFGRSVKGALISKEVDGKVCQQFVVDLELDADWPQSRTLYKEIKGKKCSKQLSIGGKLNLKNPNAISIEMTEKGMVRRINDLDLDHIACTRSKHAANPRTGFVSAIMKSLDEENAWEDVPVMQEESEAEKSNGSKPVEIEEDASKDAETALGLLQKIGRMLRTKNGGENMEVVKEETRVSKGEFEEETTSDESSISEDTAKKVEDLVDGASPGMEEDESEKGWPMDSDSDSEKEFDDEDSTDDSDDSTDESDESDDSSDDSSDESDDSSDESSDSSTSDISIDIDEEEEATTPEEDMSEEEVEAARVLMARRRHHREIAKQEKEGEDEEQMVREIAILLSKAKDMRAGNRIEKEALKSALFNVRFLLAKQITEKSDAGGKAEPGAAAAMAALIAQTGPYAPTTESAAKGDKVAGDKQQGETDMARGSVTDANKLPTYGEATKPQETAPSAAQAAGMMAAAASMSSKLPQMDETAEYGKSIEKSVESVLQKSMEATSQMVLKATQKMVEVQKEQMEMVNKRLSSLETAGGVSQGGPRGVTDGEIQKTGQKSGPVWGGIFGGAPNQAMSRM